MSDIAEQLNEAAKKATRASAQAEAWVNGPAGSFVETDSGQVPTIAELTRQNQEALPDVISYAGQAAASAASINAEAGTGSLMRVGGATILDAERYALERATGGRQTIIRDSAGNANAMFVLPRFSYADLGMTADMGTGDVTAFDFGSGSIKSEIFIGAYLASGSGAVSAPCQDPSASLDHTAASEQAWRDKVAEIKLRYPVARGAEE